MMIFLLIFIKIFLSNLLKKCLKIDKQKKVFFYRYFFGYSRQINTPTNISVKLQ